MVRSDLVRKVLTDYPAFTTAEAEKVVDTMFDSITAHLAKGGRVELRGFGVFTARERAPRLGRNPKTGKAVVVEAKRVPHFSPGKDISMRLRLAYDTDSSER